MKLLTPKEVLQALIDGKDIEYRFTEHADWIPVDKFKTTINILTGSETYFRLKPDVVVIGDVSFPKPVTEKLSWQTVYYYPSLEREELCNTGMWGNSGFDHILLQRSLIHLTEEDAVEHAKALIKLSGGIPNQGTIFGC